MNKLGKIVADAVTERIRRYRLEHENWAEGVTEDLTAPPLVRRSHRSTAG